MRNNFKELNKRLDERELEIERLNNRIDKAIEIIDLIKPELWNISNVMTYKLIDIKNILKGSDSNE